MRSPVRRETNAGLKPLDEFQTRSSLLARSWKKDRLVFFFLSRLEMNTRILHWKRFIWKVLLGERELQRRHSLLFRSLSGCDVNIWYDPAERMSIKGGEEGFAAERQILYGNVWICDAGILTLLWSGSHTYIPQRKVPESVGGVGGCRCRLVASRKPQDKLWKRDGLCHLETPLF